jgi:pyruvate formate-lyase/glycerol dehydratase family glycyl radical enzyme
VTTQARATAAQPTQGAFERSRGHLFHQFQEIPFDPKTGRSPRELEQDIEAYLQAHPDVPRVLQKAHVFHLVVTRGQIYVDPLDWFVGKLNHGGHVKRPLYGDEDSLVRRLSLRWLDEALDGVLAAEATWLDRAYRLGQASGPRGGLDRGHVAPGWDTLLSGGLVGLLTQVAEARDALGPAATAEQLAFYEAVEIVYRATLQLAARFAQQAETLARAYPEHARRLQTIVLACRNVPAHRPRTFHEALQFMWLLHELIEMEGEHVRSMGQFDRTLYPYYRADIDSGRLTRDQAKELIKFFWFKFYSRTRGHENGKNFVFGGQYPDGSEITNELTYLALEAYEELNTPDPKLSVRFLPTTSDTLYRRVADLIRKGHNAVVLMNDVPAVEALVKRGKTWEDARLYLPIGCYEPAVEGKEVGCTMNLTVNLAKGVELALHDGRDPLSGEQIGPHTGDPRGFTAFEQLWQAYTEQMDFFLERACACIRAAEGQWPQINPSPLLAGSLDDCLRRGKDVGQGGAHYNSVGFVGAALANASDALLALKQVVYDDERFTLDEVLTAVAANFEGHERMRQYLINRVPKWGNHHPEADRLAKRIADYYCHKVHTFTNGRGGPCQAALFSLDFAWQGGRRTGALPDGRRAYEPLAPGLGATYGRDRKGVTALMGSVTQLDSTLTPNGAVLDVTLHPTAVSGEDGLAAMVSLIKAFFAQGGYALQFNIYDVATLRDAQRHPENYATLQIRVTGWSVYFTTLSPYEQDQFIARISHGL